MSIPEISKQIINKVLSQTDEDSQCTIFIIGSKYVGKSTLLHSFLDKTDTPRETLVLEYSFGRKSNQKQGIEKTICHVWEYGGRLDLLKKVMSSLPIRGKYFLCIMIDISKIKSIWNTLETCIQALNDSGSSPELVLICGKYDLFKNYDSEIKKFICVTLRSVALLLDAHLIFYSSKEHPLVRRAKDMLHGMGFGTGIAFKEKNTNFSKPLVVPKGTDSWESIGVTKSTLEQVKLKYFSRIPPDTEVLAPETSTFAAAKRTHAEPALDSLAASKYKELRNLQSLDISIDDYLLSFN